MHNFLYDAIRDACTIRIEKGEEYSFNMWFEEAEKMLQYCKDNALAETQACLEDMIAEQRKYLEV